MICRRSSIGKERDKDGRYDDFYSAVLWLARPDDPDWKRGYLSDSGNPENARRQAGTAMVSCSLAGIANSYDPALGTLKPLEFIQFNPFMGSADSAAAAI